MCELVHTWYQVRDKLDFSFEDMGERQVKNIAQSKVSRPGGGGRS